MRAATGLDASVLIAMLVSAVFAGAALIFANLAAFVWLAKQYDSVLAGLFLAGFHLLAALSCVIVGRARRRHNLRLARAEAAKSPSGLLNLDPRLLLVALELGRAIGVRRLIPIAALGVLAALGGKEWLSTDTDRKNA